MNRRTSRGSLVLRSTRTACPYYFRTFVEPLEDRTLLSTVNWAVDSSQSHMSVTIPDQTITVSVSGVGNVPLKFHFGNQNQPGDTAHAWTVGNTTSLGGTLVTDYVDGSSIQFLQGQSSMNGIPSGNWIPNAGIPTPNPDYGMPGTNGYANYPTLYSNFVFDGGDRTDGQGTPPNGFQDQSTMPGEYGARIHLFAYTVVLFTITLINSDAGYFNIWNIVDDTSSGSIPISGGSFAANAMMIGSTQGNFGFYGLSVPNSGQLPHYLTTQTAPSYSNNGATTPATITNTGPLSRHLVLQVNIPNNLVLNVGGQNQTVSGTITGQLVADATLPTPALDLNGPAGGTGYTGLWSTATGPASVADPANGAATVVPAGSGNWSSMTLTLASPQPGDVLSANTAGTNITATWNGGNVLTLGGDDTPGDYQQVLRSVTYNNTSGGPGIASETINVVAVAGSQTSNLAVSTIDIDVNLPAVGLSANQSWTNAGPVAVDPAGAITDTDSTNLSKLTATLASPQAGDVLAASTAGTSISASFAGATLTLAGSDSLAHYQQVLQSITYDNTAGGPGVSSETINLVATDDGLLTGNAAVATVSLGFSSSVVNRLLFYRNSPRFDGVGGPREPLPFSDDNAIAIDKSAYLPGSGAATFANLSSYTLGINGLMVDVTGTHGALSAGDFVFKTGNNNAPSSWTTVAAAATVTTRAAGSLGLAPGGPDRIEITFPDNAIQKTWLEVIVKGNDALGGSDTNTGLAASNVFFWANGLADDGNLPDDASAFKTDANDEIDARNNPKTLLANIPITNLFDYNRDGTVSATDQLASRNNGNTNLTAPKILNISGAGPFAPDSAPAADSSASTAAAASAAGVGSASTLGTGEVAALASALAGRAGNPPQSLSTWPSGAVEHALDHLPVAKLLGAVQQRDAASQQILVSIDQIVAEHRLHDDALDGILAQLGLE